MLTITLRSMPRAGCGGDLRRRTRRRRQPAGAKGLGEIGIVGVAAAIVNAVFHATGKRIRDLPITLDKLL